MRIETNTINLIGVICCLFWFGIYAVAVSFLSISRIWLAAAHIKRIKTNPELKFTNTTKNPLNYKTT